MTALLSSPMGPPARLDIFDQPSSPILAEQELPADFDRSFGSSMSLSSSCEGFGQQLQFTFNPQAYVAPSYKRSDFTRASREATPKERDGSPCKASRACTSRTSAGLAAMFSSPHYMDISPAQPMGGMKTEFLHGREGRASSVESYLPPGSAMKEDTEPLVPPMPPPPPLLLGQSSRKSPSGTPNSVGSSLGRMFGTELSFNELRQQQQNEQGLDQAGSFSESPEKEPPLKKRPASVGQSFTSQSAAASLRPSIRSAGLPPAGLNTGRRPSLMKSFTAKPVAPHVAERKAASKILAPKHRASDSHLPSMKIASGTRTPRRRTASAESSSSEGTILNGMELDGLQTSVFALPAQPTILESPSPSALAQGNDFGSYFFDPQSPAAQRAAEVSVAPASRRRMLHADLSSSPPGSSPSNRPPQRPSLASRTFDRAHSVANVTTQGTCQGAIGAVSSRTSLGKRANPYSRRPSLAQDTGRALKSAYPILGGKQRESERLRTTAPAPRRCQSVCDASATLGLGKGPSPFTSGMRAPNAFANQHQLRGSSLPEASPDSKPHHGLDLYPESGSPMAAKIRSRPGMLRRPSKDDSSPLGYGTGRKRESAHKADGSDDTAMGGKSPMGAALGSPFGAESMPGFGASEKEGKVLPCFTVKDDGLMRITPDTLFELLSGAYDDRLESYHIIDCRFDYEYEGGHIPGAINLSTRERVKNHFLKPGQGLHANGKQLPCRSQSGKADKHGKMSKPVLIFHCEFSCQRAPKMALTLRQADRALAHDYPNCHFPEVYILQGGYCEFFKTYPSACEPKEYIRMDDPRFQDRRSSELNGFRKQFARHRSFTFGDTRGSLTSSSMLGGASVVAPSFVKSSEIAAAGNPSMIREEDSAAEDSPCIMGAGGQERSLGRSMFGTGAEDTSIGSVGDSSFEGGIGDSPCAAAGSRRPSSLLEPPAGRAGQPRGGSWGRHSFARAGTTANILTTGSSVVSPLGQKALH